MEDNRLNYVIQVEGFDGKCFCYARKNTYEEARQLVEERNLTGRYNYVEIVYDQIVWAYNREH